MNFNNFTIKAQEAIQQASEIAQGNQQQAIETAHLLKGLLTVDENVVSYVLKKLNVNLNSLNQNLESEIAKFPKVSGSNVYLSSNTNNVLQKAQSFLKEFKDEFVSVEHLLLGLLAVNDSTSKLLKEQGVNEKDLKKAILELRGDNRVTDQNAEATNQALGKYARNLNEYAESGKLDPVIGRDEEIRRVIIQGIVGDVDRRNQSKKVIRPLQLLTQCHRTSCSHQSPESRIIFPGSLRVPRAVNPDT